MLHRQQLAISAQQGACVAQLYRRLGGQLVERGFVDAKQAFNRLLTRCGLQLDGPGLNELVLVQGRTQLIGI